MQQKSFKLALAQMRVDGGCPESNLVRATAKIDEAVAHGAEVIVLPEALNLGWIHSSARTHADLIPDGPFSSALRDQARRHAIYICAGIIEQDGDSIHNSALLIDPKGEILIHHRKLNELVIGQDLYSQGARLSVAQTPLGVIGVMICSDAFARGQVVSRTLGLMGADILLSPCAWAVPADHDNATAPYGQLWKDSYGPVAKDFQLWIVGVSNVGWIDDGPWKGRKCIGCSLAVGPDGQPAVMGPYGDNADTILYLQVEPVPRPARGDCWEVEWNREAKT